MGILLTMFNWEKRVEEEEKNESMIVIHLFQYHDSVLV